MKILLFFLSILALSTTLLFIHNIWIISVVFVLTMTILLLFFREKVVTRFKSLLVVSSFILIFQLLFNQGIPLINRFSIGLTAAEKVCTLSLLILVFTAVHSASELLQMFWFLPRQMTIALTITLSLIPVIIDESAIITRAQISRGYKRGFINPVNIFFPVIIPLLHRSLERAEQLALIIVSRGYNDE